MAIFVCPLSRVDELIAARRPSRVVSLLDPATRFPDAARHGIQHHHRVEIHDITEEVAGWTCPSVPHVRSLLAFLQAWDRAEGALLVHCYAGISRSTATAFIAACLHNPGAPESAIAKALRAASPSATPNRRIVGLADKELRRDGRMLAAIDSIGRGASWAEIGEAEPFEFASRYD